MPVTYQREATLADVWDDVAELVAAHASQRRPFDDIQVQIDDKRYDAVDAVDALRIYTARDNGKIVGYAIFFVGTHHHHAQSRQALHDSWYVDPEHRGSLVGVHLLKFAEHELRADGAQVVTCASPCKHNIAPLLHRLGYSPLEVIYAKRLDGG